MYLFMKNHASRNVSCNPEQDNQIILSASRITKRSGDIVSFDIMGKKIALPFADRRYHVFQIGQVSPEILGLFETNPAWMTSTWKTFSDSVNRLPLFVDLYNDFGVHLPLHRTYWMFTRERAMIFAVDSTCGSPIDYENDQIYLRLYTNAYYTTPQASLLTTNTLTEGKTIKNNDDMLYMQTRVASYDDRPGKVFCYVNGELVDTLDMVTMKLWDVVEYVYDASVKAVHELQVKDLTTFTSIYDSQYKYLFHPPGNEDQIDYIDDVDAYVLVKSGVRFHGRYFHRNMRSNIRMVTHRDYSLSVSSFEHIATKQGNDLGDVAPDLRECYIRVYVRNSGMIRPLVYENQRIFELYKLNDTQVVQAMTGVNATVDVWKAENLENSGYAELMRTSFREIDIELIERAYGYNGISKVIGDTPSLVRDQDGTHYVDVPPAYQEYATAFEYNEAGHLLSWDKITHKTVYFPIYDETKYVEFISGFGTNAPSIYEGQDNIPIPPDNSYRIYMCYLDNGYPNGDWRDITDTALYRIVNGKLVWFGDEVGHWLQVRTDESFLCYDLEIPSIAGTFYFDLSEKVGPNERIMQIPMGKLDIFLNGRSTINNLDVIVQFPRVYVINKEYLAQPTNSSVQKLTIRFTGFCDKDLKMVEETDYGFIEHGFLSNNGKYDIRDDKVLHISVRGAIKHRDELLFSELHQGVSVVNALNGSPYQIKDVVVPLKEHADQETYAMKKASDDIDQKVSDYLSLMLPQPDRNAVSAIPSRYMLVSPFFSHLINDLASGDFNMSQLKETMTDDEVMLACKPYDGFLDYDPINPLLKMDLRFIVIHPTERLEPIGLDLMSYRFLQQVVRLYGRGLIGLSPHVNVSFGGG